jgi:uncharacterized protein (DUF486 family)
MKDKFMVVAPDIGSANRSRRYAKDFGNTKQKVITLSLFVPFSVFYMRQPFKVDYIRVSLCLLGAVYFMSRS